MRLLLDEMHAPVIANALSKRGFDVVAVAGTRSLRGFSDFDLLKHGAVTGRTLVTENVRDYAPLVTQWNSTDIPHVGVIFTSQRRFQRASAAYPGNLIAALGTFLDDPPIAGESWTWWL